LQTFLPYENFGLCAQCLDRLRLGKQRVEAWQILERCLDLKVDRWSNHPAVRMWRGHEEQLCLYGLHCCESWRKRGYNDAMTERFNEALEWVLGTERPPWLGDRDFHMSHRSNLVRKLPEHYRKFFGDIPNDLPYVWPV